MKQAGALHLPVLEEYKRLHKGLHGTVASPELASGGQLKVFTREGEEHRAVGEKGCGTH